MKVSYGAQGEQTRLKPRDMSGFGETRLNYEKPGNLCVLHASSFQNFV